MVEEFFPEEGTAGAGGGGAIGAPGTLTLAQKLGSKVSSCVPRGEAGNGGVRA